MRNAGGELILPVLAILGKRLASTGPLVLAGSVGLVAAVMLVTAIPLYSNAIATQALRRELNSLDPEVARPKAAILFTYVFGRASAPADRGQFLSVDSFLRNSASALPGLSPQFIVRYVQTDSFPLMVDGRQGARETKGDVFFASLDGFLDHIQVLEGSSPGRSGAPEALISTEGLDELGLTVGTTVNVALPQSRGTVAVPVKIVGRWNPRDESEQYWFNRPEYYKNALFVHEEALFGSVVSASPRALREYTWYTSYDPGQATVDDVEGLLAELSRLRVGAQQSLRGIRVESPLEEVLEVYRRRAFFLQALLFATGAPILAIVLQFVASAASILIEGQRAEIATLKSRGAAIKHILGIYALEWTALGGLAVVVGLPLGAVIAQLIGFSSVFLTFAMQEPLPVRLTPLTIAYAAGAAFLAIVAALVPAFEAARHSIVTFKQEVTRRLRGGFLHRYYVDLLPTPIAGYAYFMLLQRESVLPVGEAGDAFSDPLLLLAPVLFIFAVALLFLRLFPFLMAAIERLTSHFAGISVLMALRQISRQAWQYESLLLLLTLTIALGGFSASVAATLDGNNLDAATYRVGSDLRLGETGVYDEESQEWTLAPLGEHLVVQGIESAARVLRTTAIEKIGARGGEVTVLGIDPSEFGSVAYWRSDYAGQMLDELLFGLSHDDAGALIDRRLAEAYRLQIGDQLSVGFKDQTVDFTIVGIVEYFPTLYPRAGRFLIANVDHLFTQLGAQPYDVWVKLKPDASASKVVDQLRERDVQVVRFEALRQVLEERRRDITRVGAFGILSIGFIVAAVLTVFSLALHSYVSFRRRLQILGLMRAIGLSLSQLTTLYLVEQGLLVTLGVGVGILVGYMASQLYIPFLQIRMEHQSDVPPFVVATAWADLAKLLAILALCGAVALPFSLALLRRVRIHDAIRFGEERG